MELAGGTGAAGTGIGAVSTLSGHGKWSSTSQVPTSVGWISLFWTIR